jgi:glycosyltransferase involved in cell wall biosynthesis
VHANNTDIGGADYCLFKLASELDRKKFRPIVCLSKKTNILDLYNKERIKTYIVDMERIKKSKNILFLFKLLIKFLPTVWHIRRIIENERVDLVHGNDLLDIYGPIAGRLSGIPVTQYVRWIITSPGWLNKMLSHIVYSINDTVITVSDGVSKEMFFVNGCVLPNIETCYDWIDMDRVGHSERGFDIRKEFGIPPDASVIGCVGRLEQWKGQDVFIRAAAEVLRCHPDTRFFVVGGTVEGRGRVKYDVQLKLLAKKLNIENKVIFTGHRSDVAAVMKTFDVFVHSSIKPDPLPGVVMEAMCCGKPVIGANAGGVPEEIDDGVTGTLYPPGDHKQLAKKIIYFLKHSEIAQQMGMAGKERVEKVFNKQVLCANVEKVYLTMVAS